MKRIVVLAQTPPPKHGQSIMVERLVQVLRGDVFADGWQVELVEMRLSDSLKEIGGFSARKALRALFALGCLFRARLRGKIDVLYYVPATGLRSQLYRDWLLLGLGRRLASRTFLHWHGLGLRELYETSLRDWEKWLTRWTYGRHDTSLLVNPTHADEVRWAEPRNVKVFPNFIADPCSDFRGSVLPRRDKRFGVRRHIFDRCDGPNAATEGAALRVLFLGHCTRSKGLFDLINAVALANAQSIERGARACVRLEVAGEFFDADERAEFERRIAAPEALLADGEQAVAYLGYLEDAAKKAAFLRADVFCLPTYFRTETQGVVLIEALNYGLEVIVTDWHGLPAMLPETVSVVPVRSPASICRAILQSAVTNSARAHREYFLERYEEGAAARQFRLLLEQ